MRLLPLAALRRDREQFIYNWMLEDNLDLGRLEGSKRTRGKADKPRALLCKPSRDVDSRKPRALLCKPSRDEDLRKLVLSVMPDQGRQKGLRYKKGIYANRTDIYGKPNIGIVRHSSRNRKKKGRLQEKGSRIGIRKYKTALTAEAGRAQVHTSPTPERGVATGAHPITSPTPSSPLLPPSPPPYRPSHTSQRSVPQ